MSQFREPEQDTSPATPALQEYSPRRYSIRSSAVTTVKLLIIGGSLLALIWMLDVLVTP